MSAAFLDYCALFISSNGIVRNVLFGRLAGAMRRFFKSKLKTDSTDAAASIATASVDVSAASKNTPAANAVSADSVGPYDASTTQKYPLTADGLTGWAKSDEFRSVIALSRHFEKFDSLQSATGRALLYHIVMSLRPQRVLEIGTFKAGTAHFIAQALHHAGGGVLDTIDPFGLSNKVPEKIKAWPAHLRHYVKFSPVSSAAFFDEALAEGIMFDMVLVDGNHELEYAAFDLACAARLINPGGVIVLDNVDQPGPRVATQQFLQANPLWQEVNACTATVEPANRSLIDLPGIGGNGGPLLRWLAAEGVTVAHVEPDAAGGYPAVTLEARGPTGYHRIGFEILGLAKGGRHRFIVRLARGNSSLAVFDVRDMESASSRIFCDLFSGTVKSRMGPRKTVTLSKDADGWVSMTMELDSPSGHYFVYLSIQDSKGEVLFDGDTKSSIKLGGVQLLTADAEGVYREAEGPGPRDLRAVNRSDPFGVISPSFPDTRLFVLKAPDALIVSDVPRSFGSVRSIDQGVARFELDVAGAARGELHYQVFCRAFREQSAPEELNAQGSFPIDLAEPGKVRFELPHPLKLQTPPEQSHARIEVVLAFVSGVEGQPLQISARPVTSEI